MKILGIDTSNLVLSLALLDDDKLLGEYTTNLKKNHSVRLMPAISSLLEELDVDPIAIDGIAVAHGPGSYTGVRIGVTAAKALAWASDIPIVGISSLEVIAANAPFFQGYVSPIFDARRGQVYTSLFAQGERKEEDAIRDLRTWLSELAVQQQPVLILGDTAAHRTTILDQLAELAQFGYPEWNIPRGSTIARMGLEEIRQNRSGDVSTFAPQYLQLAEAEAKWLASQNQC